MTKQLAYLVLIISLVGQLLLTPAMAMPSFLHAFAHAQMSNMTHDEAPLPLLTSIKQSPTLLPSMVNTSLEAAQDSSSSKVPMAHGEQDCDMMMSNLAGSSRDILIDCDALCEMMGAGDCVSHCASATGILIQAQFTLISPVSTAPVQNSPWATQTADLASLNPPPIWTSLT